MKIHICSGEQAAVLAADRYVELLNRKPNAVLGFATGSTPLPLYRELIKRYQRGELSFRQATSFNLDEYVGLDGSSPQSYRYFMNKNLFEQIDIQLERTFVPCAKNCSEKSTVEYDEKIERAGGIDLQLLGVGRNGHIGFNEPGTSFDSLTHRVQLSRSTREANARFFHSLDEVPSEAVSMGIKTVMNARSILLFALGEEKAEVIQKAIYGPVTEDVPASILQLHPFVELFLDPEAAKLL